MGNSSKFGICTSPYDENISCKSSDGGITLYSYGIKISTTDSNNNVLSGAEYKLYSDASLQNEIGTFTSEESTNGQINIITGLEPGTYYVKQAVSPNGAQTNNNVYPVEVDLLAMDYTNLNVVNTGGRLPVTGGKGTMLLIIGGLSIIFIAFYYLLFNKKIKKSF